MVTLERCANPGWRFKLVGLTKNWVNKVKWRVNGCNQISTKRKQTKSLKETKNKHFYPSTIVGIENVSIFAYLFSIYLSLYAYGFCCGFVFLFPSAFQMPVTFTTLLLGWNISKPTTIFKLFHGTFFFYLKRCVWFRKYKEVALLSLHLG